MAQDKDFEIFVERWFGRHRQQIDNARENKHKGSEEDGRVRNEKAALYAVVSDDCPADGISAPYASSTITAKSLARHIIGFDLQSFAVNCCAVSGSLRHA